MNVIKVGGNELVDDKFLERFAVAVAGFGEPVVIVHGGGRGITELQEKLGITTKVVDGLRVTDAQSVRVAQMVLSGDANKTIVRALLAVGVLAIGLSGVDGGLLCCEKKRYPGQELGYVGQIVQINRGILDLMMDNAFTPVISPISLGTDGMIYNVNADEAAGAIATAMRAKRVWFISNVAGVLDRNQQTIDTLTSSEASQLMDEKTIRDGMAPKVRTALELMGAGVPEVYIANLDGLVDKAGTRFVRSSG